MRPCRLLDSRDSGQKVEGNQAVTIATAGRCGITGAITAVVVTITAVGPDGSGYVTAWATGTPMPLASSLNFLANQVISNGAIIPVSSIGSFDVLPSVRAHLVVDVTGVFSAAATATAGRYIPVAPVRLIDTRVTRRPAAGETVRVPLPLGVPKDTTALSVTITTISANGSDFLTAFPSGDPRPLASVINTDAANQTRATGQIVPVNDRGFDIYTKAGSEVIVDIGGWFTGASAPSSDAGLFVSVAPTRLVDTRGATEIYKAGTLVLDPTTVSGRPIAALVANWTSTHSRGAGFIAAYPAQTPRPAVSTVNTDRRAQTVASLGIIPVSTRGVAVFANAGSHLVVDVTGWFTGQPVTATTPPERNDAVVYPALRVLLMGDSSMAGIRWYTGSHHALGGNVEYILDMESCRRLIRSSCRGREGRVPPNAVTAIAAQPGTFDVVVIQTGYNDQYTYFPDAFAQTVAAARAKGATQIIWLTYREGASYVNTQFDQSLGNGFAIQNTQLKALVASGGLPRRDGGRLVGLLEERRRVVHVRRRPLHRRRRLRSGRLHLPAHRRRQRRTVPGAVAAGRRDREAVRQPGPGRVRAERARDLLRQPERGPLLRSRRGPPPRMPPRFASASTDRQLVPFNR